MNFLREFIIFASLAVATIQAQGSTRPDDYVDGEEERDCNSKMMNQYKLMEGKFEHIYKIMIEEKNKLNKLKEKIVELNQTVNEKKNSKYILQKENLELNQRIQELVRQIDENGTLNIFEASKTGSIAAVRYWYAKDPSSIHKKDENTNNYTPLQMASFYGYLDIVVFLLFKGVDVDAMDSLNRNTTALMDASYKGHVHVVKALIENRANIDHRNIVNETSLHMAVQGNELPVVQLLMQCGANQNLRDKWDRTPLDLAIEIGDKSIIEYLGALYLPDK